ncbi:MAG TPA: TonB-dependent receptor [Candidatus Eremiobacteraceae bacterium]|nr:TonB-dependent receptor [Candidatus Eremiobacteraceae bacterium]
MFLGLMLAVVTPAFAGTTGVIDGTVTDSQSGAGLAGVTVSAASPSEAKTVTTDSKGFFVIQALPPDTYTVTFSREGYSTEAVEGITVIQDQIMLVNQQLKNAPKVLGQVSVTAASSLVQKNQPADVYTISGQQLNAATGGDDLHKTLYEYMDALPGVTTNGFPGQPRIRGGEVTDLAYEFDGIPIQERITGFFTTNLSNIGVSSVELYTGGYGAEYGNAGEGVLNSVVKVGTYPAQGTIAFGTTSRDYNHRFTLDYGSATPDRRFSYYFGFDGVNSQNEYNYGEHTYPDLLYGFFNGDGPVWTRDMVANLHYHPNEKDDWQVLLQNGYGLFDFDYLLYGGTQNAPNLRLAPCPGAVVAPPNTTWTGGMGGTAADGQACPEGLQFVALQPGTGNKWNHYSGLGKIQLNHTINEHSLISLRVAENFNQYIFDQKLTDPNYPNFENNPATGTSFIQGCPAYPYAAGSPLLGSNGADSFPCTFDIEDFYGDRRSNMYVFNADYDNQLSDNLTLKIGANEEFDRNLFRYYLLNFFGPTGWPDNYLASQVPTHLSGGYAETEIHTGRFLLAPGVRYDREWYGIPVVNGQKLAFSTGGFSPRFAGTYTLNNNNVIRFTYGLTNSLIGSGYVYRDNSGTYNPSNTNFSAQPQINHNADLMFEHAFADGVTTMKFGPWWHKTDNYYSFYQPIIGKNPDGSEKLGPPVLSNAGHDNALGAEFDLSHVIHGDGLSWWLTGTYDNYWTTSTGQASFVNFPLDQNLINAGFRVRDPSNPLLSGTMSADWHSHGWDILPFAYYQTHTYYNVYNCYVGPEGLCLATLNNQTWDPGVGPSTGQPATPPDATPLLQPEQIAGAWWLANISVLHDLGTPQTSIGVRVTNIFNVSFNTTPCQTNGTGCYPFDGPQSGIVNPVVSNPISFEGAPAYAPGTTFASSTPVFINQNITDYPRTYEFFVIHKF